MRNPPRLVAPLIFATAFGTLATADSGEGASPERATDSERPASERVAAQVAEREEAATTPLVDLTGDELPALTANEPDAPPLVRPWYDKLDITGFGSAGYLDSDGHGTHPEGGFVVKESALFLEAEAWENVSILWEIQVTPELQDDRVSFETGELYAHVRDLWRSDRGDYLGVKLGRIDIPFGEEYVWGDSPENPMISHTVGFPWLWDEGLLVYGFLGGVSWVTSVTDGVMSRSINESASHAFNVKVGGRPVKPVNVTVSAMWNGDTPMSALYMGKTCFQPVGARVHGQNVPSALDASPSETVDVALLQGDATVTGPGGAALWLSLGRGTLDDAVDAHDRPLGWFAAQLRVGLPLAHTYAVARYSEFGTYDDEKGYLVGGGFLSDGRSAFGYDVRRMRRASAGVGWRPNPNTVLKIELGQDRFNVIEASPLDATSGDLVYSAAELVVTF